MLLAVLPPTLVLPPIRPHKPTLSLPFVLYERPDVLLLVGPTQVTLPVHFVVDPLTIVLLAVDPQVSAATLDLIHVELSIVNAAISEGQFA